MDSKNFDNYNGFAITLLYCFDELLIFFSASDTNPRIDLGLYRIGAIYSLLIVFIIMYSLIYVLILVKGISIALAQFLKFSGFENVSIFS